MIRLVAWIFIFALLSQGAQARVVNSMEDEVRLNGFQDHLDHQQQAEDKRLSDVGDIKKEKAEWEAKMNEALEAYRIEKSHQAKTVDDTGPEYQEDLNSRLEDFDTDNEDRKEFVDERNRVREIDQHDVTLSEEAEYFIADSTVRVDWNRRKFWEGAKGYGSGSGVFVPNGINNNGEAPPPPPAMPYYSPPQQNWETPPPPPPPPPGMFEEENPF